MIGCAAVSGLCELLLVQLEGAPWGVGSAEPGVAVGRALVACGEGHAEGLVCGLGMNGAARPSFLRVSVSFRLV